MGQLAPASAGCIDSIRTSDRSGPTATVLRSGPCDLADIALDTIPTFGAERIYWAVAAYLGRIVSCRTDGTGWTLVADEIPYPTSIAVDRLEGKIYFTSDEGIQRMNLDGTDRETIFPDVRAYTIAL